MDGVQVSWGAIAGIVGFVAMVGPAFIWMGRISKQVDVNTKNIGVVFNKLDAIHDDVKVVKNGKK